MDSPMIYDYVNFNNKIFVLMLYNLIFFYVYEIV